MHKTARQRYYCHFNGPLPPTVLPRTEERKTPGGGREDLEIKWIVPSLLRAKERRVITTDRVLTRGKKLFLLFPPPVLLCDCGRRSARVVVLCRKRGTAPPPSILLIINLEKETRRPSGRFDTAESAKIKCLTALIVPRRLWGNIILRVCPTNDNDTIGRREVCCWLSYPVSIEISSSSSFFPFL